MSRWEHGELTLFLAAMQTASKNLMETLSDIYEKEWVGQDMLYVQVRIHTSCHPEKLSSCTKKLQMGIKNIWVDILNFGPLFLTHKTDMIKK